MARIPVAYTTVQVTIRLRIGRDGHPDLSRLPSRPIRSPRYIVNCTRMRAQVYT